MTDEKLAEKCLLSEDEIRMHSEYYYPNSKAMARRLDKVLKAQLTKAIPIIQADIEARHEEEIAAVIGLHEARKIEAYREGVADTKREIGEWGDEECLDHGFIITEEEVLGHLLRRECPKCWEALKSSLWKGEK